MPILLFILMTACLPTVAGSDYSLAVHSTDTPAASLNAQTLTPFPTRPPYSPGELVDYIVQTGDTLPALAIHFNTTENEIRSANPIIPEHVTSLPPGMPMKIPIYYEALWGSQYQILPDSLYPNGPAQNGFSTVEFVNSQPGWLKNYEDYTGGMQRRGGEIIDAVSLNYSVSPRLLLALIEYQTHALSDPNPPSNDHPYLLGFNDYAHRGLARQLNLSANILNNQYYGWRTGQLQEFTHLDGRLEHPDPWQNAASVALQVYYSRIFDGNEYDQAISTDGLAKTYATLFGDPWVNSTPHIPGSLEQPNFYFPFEGGKSWTFTGGPHTGWGIGEPFAAVDFAPPAKSAGCVPTAEKATAIADGIIVRSDTGMAILDLDGDGNERTGWAILYLHLATSSIPPVGTRLKAGQPIGLPSCEGGEATGTHLHIARKYNGEWMPAGGVMAFNFEGWTIENGIEAYQGIMRRYNRIVTACTCSDLASQVTSRPR